MKEDEGSSLRSSEPPALDLPNEDPIGTVRAVNGHVFVKLAEPADEPWHIAWCKGEQNMSGWQSNEDMVGAVKWHGYLPVRECGTEGRQFVSWEHWLETKQEMDEAYLKAAAWQHLYEQHAGSLEDAALFAVALDRARRDRGERHSLVDVMRELDALDQDDPLPKAPSEASQEGSS